MPSKPEQPDRLMFFHAHIEECDPVCVLESFGRNWQITWSDQTEAAAPDPADYARWVTRVAQAIHEDCLLEWQGIAVVDPKRQITMHMADAHYGMAHDLVRRLALAAQPAPPTEALLLLTAMVDAWFVYSDDAARKDVMLRLAELDTFHEKAHEARRYLASATEGETAE